MSSVGTQLNTFHDASGKVTVAVFTNRGNPERGVWIGEEILVGDGEMIAIGGGAAASDGSANTFSPPGGPGALLTASFPNGDLSGWVVGSRDHQSPQTHGLVSYVIGMKIEGMSRQQLKDAVFVSVGDSGGANHAEAEAGVPSGEFVLIGGGFRVDQGAANLATASFPSTEFSWKARSQDHQVASPANLRVFAICLRRNLPAGPVTASIQRANGVQAPHPASVANVAPGFALTGGGAEVPQVNNGNFLWKLEPATSEDPSFSAASKDHFLSAPCPIMTFALGIRIG
jgi:hypothetical protein